MVTECAERIDLFTHMSLAGLCTHDHSLLLVNIHFQVSNRFIAAICNQNEILEPCILEILEDCFQASGIGCVAGKCPVIHRHMLIQRINNNFCSLRKR